MFVDDGETEPPDELADRPPHQGGGGGLRAAPAGQLRLGGILQVTSGRAGWM